MLSLYMGSISLCWETEKKTVNISSTVAQVGKYIKACDKTLLTWALLYLLWRFLAKNCNKQFRKCKNHSTKPSNRTQYREKEGCSQTNGCIMVETVAHQDQQAGHYSQHHDHDDGDDASGEVLHGESGALLVNIVNQDLLHLELLASDDWSERFRVCEQRQRLHLKEGYEVRMNPLTRINQNTFLVFNYIVLRLFVRSVTYIFFHVVGHVGQVTLA